MSRTSRRATLAAAAALLAPASSVEAGGRRLREERGGRKSYRVDSAAEIRSVMEDKAKPGDTLVMDIDGDWTDADIEFRGFGTAKKPITLRSKSSTEPVVLDGSSKLRLSGSHLVVDGLFFKDGSLSESKDQVIQFRTSPSELADHCRLTNTAIVDYNPSDSDLDYRWVGLYGTHNTVDRCYFRGKNHQGELMVVWRQDNTPDYHTIERNYFGDIAYGNGTNGWEAIRIGTSSTSLSNSSSVVSENLFERCNGETEIVSVRSGDNVLSKNTFDSSGGSLVLRHGRGNVVDGNFFMGKGAANTGGVRIIDANHTVINNYFDKLRGSNTMAAIVFSNGLDDTSLDGYYAAENTTVACNTIYDCKEAFRLGWRSSKNSIKVKDCVVANNSVFSKCGVATRIVYNEDAPDNMLYEGNHMYGEAGVSLGLDLAPAGIEGTDPDLVVDADGLHRPGATSPCVDGAAGARPLSVEDIGGAIGPNWWTEAVTLLTHASQSIEVATHKCGLNEVNMVASEVHMVGSEVHMVASEAASSSTRLGGTPGWAAGFLSVVLSTLSYHFK